MIEAYPLCWPETYPRATKQKFSKFKTTPGSARDFVKDEIRRIKGSNPIISTNIPIKQNGDLYADWTRYKIEDHGVAVYFELDGNQVCLCCDTFDKFWWNLHAIGRTIEAMRQIDRDGVSDFINRAFTGFKAIAGPVVDYWKVLGIIETKDKDAINKAWKQKAKQYFHDDHVALREINVARDECLKMAK